MTQFFSRFGVFVYALLCVITLAWWLPHFFAVNLALAPAADYRYWTATGIPYGLFLLTAIGRQSLSERLELLLVLQLLLTSITLYASKLTFYYTPQSNFFCPLHVWLCFACILINLYQYRRKLRVLENRRPQAA